MVGMSLRQAKYLGMAPSVAGGCVAVGAEGLDAAEVVGHDCIGIVPEDWALRDGAYSRLTAAQISRIKRHLTQRCDGWAGAARVNTERAQTLAMLGID